MFVFSHFYLFMPHLWRFLLDNLALCGKFMKLPGPETKTTIAANLSMCLSDAGLMILGQNWGEGVAWQPQA